MTALGDIRVGQGFDIHQFTDDSSRTLVLGGVVFPDSPGLVGHSDADVVAHACADALLGAAGLGDIGMHFPDTDERWRGANSITWLACLLRMGGELPILIRHSSASSRKLRRVETRCSRC
jgi:2-C-methyl-D-erythritol 2,4-cyclodiphosphate synthase